MNISSISMGMANANLQTNIGIALMGKSIEMGEVIAENIVKMMETSVQPYLGQNIDLKL